MKRSKRGGLADEWNFFSEAANVDELRACLVYEFARESELLQELAHLYGKAVREEPAQISSGLLASIRGISHRLAQLLGAMGSSASLKSPWIKVSKGARDKMIKALKVVSAARMATPNECKGSYCWPFLDGEPSAFTVDTLDSKPEQISLQTEDPQRIMSIVYDSRASARQIKKDVERLLRKEIFPFLGGEKGRSASRREDLLKRLRALASMRLLAGRDLALARTLAQSAGHGHLLPATDSDKYRFERQRIARETFRALFPTLLACEEAGEHPVMISEDSYGSYRSKGRGRPRKR